MEPLLIRRARPDDLPAVNDIFNDVVHAGPFAHETAPIPLADRQEWYHRRGPAFPVLVACIS